ncbi:Hypothetical protein, putative [Bodo saltans]|uniref:Uncharacterized protein n=1 Tax=Bodo saltans TaxID=75058 RepID=A0A0S4JJ07_BODSA|nr:Hypothetical protein, putative [Bodo saltans]|eukprot:CUG90342.1 Hypothetical protein, putative [Bodo saltans]
MRRITRIAPERSGLRFCSAPSWVSKLRDDAKAAEKSISYDIKIYDPLVWRKKRFVFEKDSWDPQNMSSMLRKKLCLGSEENEYTVIGEAFAFPDKEDSPVVNEPQFSCKLLWDHNSPTEKIMVQLSENFPPLLWLTVKPTHDALKKIFGEFLEVDTQHMKKYLPYYEETQNSLETRSNEKLGDTLSQVQMKDRFIEDMRKRDPRSVELDYENEFSFFMGTTSHFRLVEDAMMKKNPFVFGWPLLVSEGNHHLDGTPLRMSSFRTIYSRSLLMFNTRLDLQLDHRLTKLHPGDDGDSALLEVPVFCTTNYATNARMCGGKPLVQRYNQVMGTSFPLDMPVDVLATFSREQTIKGEAELLDELKFLKAASEKTPDIERVFRVTEDMLSSNRIIGQLAYTIVYLALVGHSRFIEDVFELFKSHPSDIVRVACAKGAHIFARKDLIDAMVSKEPEGRCKMMIMSCAGGLE